MALIQGGLLTCLARIPQNSVVSAGPISYQSGIKQEHSLAMTPLNGRPLSRTGMA